MSTELDTFEPNQQSIADYLGLNPNSPATHAVIAVCQRYDLDPVLKHVIVIPKGGVYLTRDGLLHIAHRSGQLDGIVVERDPEKVGDEWVATVAVYRKDMGHPFRFSGRYPVNGGNRQYAPEMALKAAEAHALRRAFDVNGIPTLDEQRPETERPAAAGRSAVASAVGVEPAAPSTPDEADVDPEPLTDRTRKHLFALLNDAGITDSATQRAGMSQILGREVESRSTLTEDEGRTLIVELEARATQDGADQ